MTSFGEVEGIFADYLANRERYARCAGRRAAATPRTVWRPTRHEAGAGARPARPGRGRVARRRRRARHALAPSPSSRSASRRSTTIARCGRDFPKSSRRRERRRSRSSPSRSASPSAAMACWSRESPTSGAARCVPRFPGIECNAVGADSVASRPSAAAGGAAGTRADRHGRHERSAGGRRSGRDGRRDGLTRGAAHGRRRRRHSPAARAARRCSTRPRVDHRRRGDGRRAAVRRRRAGARAGDRRSDERRIRCRPSAESRRCSTMLNSCAAGVTVVNIDNGFGAAVAAAARILQRVEPRRVAARVPAHSPPLSSFNRADDACCSRRCCS